MIRAAIEQDGKVQIPQWLLHDWPARGLVELVPTNEGILLRPARQLTWDEVFAGEPVEPGVTEPKDLSADVSGDDLYL